MRITATADLHWCLYPKGDECTIQLANHVNQSDADVFIIAGDIADSNLKNFAECLNLFKSFDGEKILVPGNHDLWTTDGNSQDLYKSKLPNIVKECGFHYLDKTPLIVGSTAFIGNIGWYDYSFKSSDLNIEIQNYREKRVPGLCSWNDRLYIDWDLTDEDFTDKCLHRLQQHYSEIKDQVDHIICVMHHLPFEELVYGKINKPLEFCKAYLGSRRFGELMLQFPKLSHVICGHRHGRDMVKKKGFEAFVVGSEYKKKRCLQINSKKGSSNWVEFLPSVEDVDSTETPPDEESEN